ncbi:lysophosphatidylcholine acyltransferase [Simiduia litorea]|uniref:1-acyl-sn-glycerol-3-phosphate acyltransferase n=1 Tax=Simiduia litorea TaxID=1435348 RepID=UPI0036F31C9F
MTQTHPIVPSTPEAWPKLGNRFTRWLGRNGLRVMGWRCLGNLPETGKLVVIGGPHTSNWDFVIAMFAIMALGVKVSWLAKDSIFRWPVKGLWLKLGGIPVDRASASGMVGQAIESLKQNTAQIVCLMPEGTRSKVDKWRTGFLHIAKGAQVPIFMVGMDFPSKTVNFGNMFTVGDDLEADLEKVKQFVRSFRGKRPAFQS